MLVCTAGGEGCVESMSRDGAGAGTGPGNPVPSGVTLVAARNACLSVCLSVSPVYAQISHGMGCGHGGRLFRLGCTAHAYQGIACAIAAGCQSVEARRDSTVPIPRHPTLSCMETVLESRTAGGVDRRRTLSPAYGRASQKAVDSGFERKVTALPFHTIFNHLLIWSSRIIVS